MNIKKVRRIIRLVFALTGISFVTWQIMNMQAKGVDASLMESDARVEVYADEEILAFAPAVDTASVALMFYPGALVDPEAYVPMAYDIAKAGYRTVIVKVPYRIDMMEWQSEAVTLRTLDVAEEFEREWVFGGHSRGGRMTLEFLRKHPSLVEGLLLVGTSHPREVDFSQLKIPVVKVYGSEDGLASPEEVRAGARNLPEHTEWVLIEGGNHAQFAWYGKQFGDDRATISRQAQQEQLVAAAVSLLDEITATPD